MTSRRLWSLIGKGAVAIATLLVLGGLAAPISSHVESVSSLQLLIAASPSTSEPGVWSIGVRAFDRQEGNLLSEPAIDTGEGEEATFVIYNARTGEDLRLVIKVERGERSSDR